MNGKRAKTLRRLAENVSVGMPKKAYKRDDKGTVHLIKGCTREVYQGFKKFGKTI